MIPVTRTQGATFNTNRGTIATTTGTATFTTTATINYCIDGKSYSQSAFTASATPTTDYNKGSSITFTPIPVGGGYGCVFVWGITAAGAIKVMQGPLTPWNGSVFARPPAFPDVPDDVCPIAYQIVTGGSTVAAAWAFGTSYWGATGITSANPTLLWDLPTTALVS